LRNNLKFLKNIFGLTGFSASLLTFTLPSHSSLYLGEWLCQEEETYNIINIVVNNKKLKKYPTEFYKTSNKNLRVFKVSYDLKKRIATINGSNAIVSVFNEHQSKLSRSKTTKENYFEDNIREEDYLFPITLISSYQTLDIKTENNAGFFKDSLIENSEKYEDRNFFIIENHLKNNSNFTAINLSSQDNLITTTGSNDESSEKFNSEKYIKVSVGRCNSQKIKN